MNKTKQQEHPDQEILHRVRTDTDATLVEMYKQYRTPFLNWSTSSFNLDENTAQDIFQEVIIAFYNNVVTLKLQTLDASLKSYLFTIGKYKILNRYQKAQIKNETFFDDFSQWNITDWNLETSAGSEKSVAEEKVIAALDLIGDNCKKLLKMFYFESLSHKDIVSRMGYNTVEVSRSMKKKCLDKLRKIISNF